MPFTMDRGYSRKETSRFPKVNPSCATTNTSRPDLQSLLAVAKVKATTEYQAHVKKEKDATNFNTNRRIRREKSPLQLPVIVLAPLTPPPPPASASPASSGASTQVNVGTSAPPPSPISGSGASSGLSLPLIVGSSVSLASRTASHDMITNPEQTLKSPQNQSSISGHTTSTMGDAQRPQKQRLLNRAQQDKRNVFQGKPSEELVLYRLAKNKEIQEAKRMQIMDNTKKKRTSKQSTKPRPPWR